MGIYLRSMIKDAEVEKCPRNVKVRTFSELELHLAAHDTFTFHNQSWSSECSSSKTDLQNTKLTQMRKSSSVLVQRSAQLALNSSVHYWAFSNGADSNQVKHMPKNNYLAHSKMLNIWLDHIYWAIQLNTNITVFRVTVSQVLSQKH